MARFELWFDFSCPYAYLAVGQAEALAARVGAELDLRPMLLGGVFGALGVPQKLFATMSPAKTRHNLADMHRWARLFGAPLEMRPDHPVRTVDALRAVLATGEVAPPLVKALFRAYWVDHLDITSDEVLSAALSGAGYDPRAVLERAKSQEVKDDLRARTDEAIARGVFGAPAMFVDGELYWGQDRLQMVERALGGSPAALAPSQGELRYDVDFWFDYSSPFAYLASRRIDDVLGARARWRPMLLGAVFKQVEMANVPLFSMSEAKRAYYEKDLARQSAAAKAELSWPTRFPMNTVLPLRVTLAAGAHETPEGRRLVHRLFRAYWVEDRDISDPATVAGLATELGLDGPGLVAGAGEAEVKAALRASTDAAVQAGVFGAPTFVVRGEGEAPALFWGADRLELAARAAAGDERMWA